MLRDVSLQKRTQLMQCKIAATHLEQVLSLNPSAALALGYMEALVFLHLPGSKLLILGMVIAPLLGNPCNGYINPYRKVDDHPYLKTMGV